MSVEEMQEKSYYMANNQPIRYTFRDPIEITDTETYPSVEIRYHISEVVQSPHDAQYIQWLERNPDFDSLYHCKSKAVISTWKDYAFHTSEGRITDHLSSMIAFDDERISSRSKCIHNDLMSSANCAHSLYIVLSGSVMLFRKFLYNTLCYDCLMLLCSDLQNIERLFAEYHTIITHWDLNDSHQPLPFGKEIHYLSSLLLRYQSFVIFVLDHDTLYSKIFSMFVFYMKNFKRLRDAIKDESIFFYTTDQGYQINKRCIHVVYMFEYTFNAILSVMRRIMRYFKPKHLRQLIEMNYFKYFTEFVAELFDLEYMRILTDSVIPQHNMVVKSTVTLFQLLSVVEYINEQVLNKLKNTKRHIKIQETKEKIKRFNSAVNLLKACLNDPIYVESSLKQIFKNFRYLKEEFKCFFMMNVMKCNTGSIWTVQKIMESKSIQRTKLRRCGSRYCQTNNQILSGKTLKLCNQCKIVFYCNKHCQKMDWLNHRTYCQLFKLH
eukprot:29381_1